jgi:LTXXQ motif family protein
MRKSMLAGAVALAVAGAGVAFAQQGPDTRPAQSTPPATQASPAPQSSPQQSGPAQSGSAQAQSDAQGVAEGRLAQLRARLSLTQDQEKNWWAFDQAYRDFVRLRSERWHVSAQRRSDNPVENFQMWTDFMSRRVNGMKRLADAAAPLYQSLDQNQQRRFIDQIYAWHPRLAWMNERLSARGRSDDDGGRRGGPWAGRQGCEGRFGHGMGPRWGYDRDNRDDDGGCGRGFGYGPRQGWHDGDGERGGRGGYGRGSGEGMCPRRGWRGDDNDWREDHGGYERGPRYGMGPRGGWGSRDDDWSDNRGGYERGPHHGMGPRGGWDSRDDDWSDNRGGYERGPHHGMGPWGGRDRDELDGSRGGWKGPQDWRDRGGSPNEEHF